MPSTRRSRVAKPTTQDPRRSHALIHSKLTAPLSELPQVADVPAFDIDAFVHRSTETRHAELATKHSIRANFIPRPPTRFMLYQKCYWARANAFYKNLDGVGSFVASSMVCGRSWQIETAKCKRRFEEWGRIENDMHLAAFPDYKFYHTGLKAKKVSEALREEEPATADTIVVRVSVPHDMDVDTELVSARERKSICLPPSTSHAPSASALIPEPACSHAADPMDWQFVQVTFPTADCKPHFDFSQISDLPPQEPRSLDLDVEMTPVPQVQDEDMIMCFDQDMSIDSDLLTTPGPFLLSPLTPSQDFFPQPQPQQPALLTNPFSQSSLTQSQGFFPQAKPQPQPQQPSLCLRCACTMFSSTLYEDLDTVMPDAGACPEFELPPLMSDAEFAAFVHNSGGLQVLADWRDQMDLDDF